MTRLDKDSSRAMILVPVHPETGPTLAGVAELADALA